MTGAKSEISWTTRPMTCVEMGGTLRSFLDAEDDMYLTSHSMKSTTLSWASKAEMPREYRRILGRHSSDSVYSRDLSFGPVRALERVFVMIRDKSFAPDGPRSQFFPMTPQPGGAPAFRPTPVFQACSPSTPMVNQPHANEKLESQTFEESKAVAVKAEPSEVDGASATGLDISVAETVDVSSESESASSSEAETALVSSDDDKGIVQQQLKIPKVSRVAESPDLNEVWMQNPSSKIVHAISKDVSRLGSLSITKCGRRADHSFNSVAVLTDWTAKCRICIRGRRQPEVG